MTNSLPWSFDGYDQSKIYHDQSTIIEHLQSSIAIPIQQSSAILSQDLRHQR